MDANADTGAADDGRAEKDPPLTVEVLADLQAGLLDDAAAARVRRQVRADPRAERALRALHRVRREVAAAGDDPASAPDVPPAVTARISAALTSPDSAPGGAPTHSARPHTRPARTIAAAAGVFAVLAAIAVGTAALLRAPTPMPSTPATALHITVSTPPMVIPLTQHEIWDLLGRAPDYGPLGSPLGDPARLASCLGGLGYPASTPVLGARPIEINAHPGVLLVVAADTLDKLAVFAVASSCSAADTGLLASTQVSHP